MGGVYLHLHPDVLDRLLSSKEDQPFLSTRVFPEDPLEKNPVDIERSEKRSTFLKETAPLKKVGLSWNLQEMNHLSWWSERKRGLDIREKELRELEVELREQSEDIDKKILYLEKERSKVSSILQDRIILNEKRIKKLVDVYSHMKPKTAAKIMSRMNENLAISILGKIKKLNAAEIMNRLDPEKVKKTFRKICRI